MLGDGMTAVEAVPCKLETVAELGDLGCKLETGDSSYAGEGRAAGDYSYARGREDCCVRSKLETGS